MNRQVRVSLQKRPSSQKFDNKFVLNSQVHSCNTRSINSFRLPYCRTNVRKFSICFEGPKFFNALASDVQNASSTADFTYKLKTFLLE